jgi:hypothetical protein
MMSMDIMAKRANFCQTSATEVWREKEWEECSVDALKKILQIRVEWALVWKWNNETGTKQNTGEHSKFAGLWEIQPQ